MLFFLNDTATTEIYTLSLHDALPICSTWPTRRCLRLSAFPRVPCSASSGSPPGPTSRSEEHASELQSLTNLVCRLLLEKKKNKKPTHIFIRQTSNTTTQLARPRHSHS